MSAKFTKGPWEFDEYRNLIANGKVLKAEGVSIPCGYARDEVIANMNLIAVAPDMYEMLNLFILYVDGDSAEDMVYHYQEIKQILAKARGDA